MSEKVIRDGSGPDEGKRGSGRHNDARKGAGRPRSSRGKKAVRLNPLRHGVLSQTPVIPLEIGSQFIEPEPLPGWTPEERAEDGR